MSVRIPSTISFEKALRDVGYALPRECRSVELVVGVDSPYILRFECNVTVEDLEMVGRALANVAKAHL